MAGIVPQAVSAGVARWNTRILQALFVAALLALAGCATRPGAEALLAVDAAVEGAQTVAVHTATTREREANGARTFTAERAEETSYARFTISVPPDHQPGHIEWARGLPDPAKTFAVLEERPLSESAFLDSVTASSTGTARNVTVFVHGYNQNFPQALFRLAQMSIDADLDGAAVLFAWPSQAALAGYVADKDSATYSRDYLADMLTAMARDRRIGDITVLAHSMGAWLTVEALRQLRLSGRADAFDHLQVVLAAPDIDIDVFRAQMAIIGTMEPPMVVLTAPDDRALFVSRYLGAAHQRVGALDVNDPRVREVARETNIAIVDISGLEALDGLHHSRYASLAAIYPQLSREEAGLPSSGLRQAGAFVFNAVGTTLSSPFILVGEALANE